VTSWREFLRCAATRDGSDEIKNHRSVRRQNFRAMLRRRAAPPVRPRPSSGRLMTIVGNELSNDLFDQDRKPH